jgi:hypothetical protein
MSEIGLIGLLAVQLMEFIPTVKIFVLFLASCLGAISINAL